MSISVLTCSCGLRMKAKGATPGRVGRCPRCGQMLRVPDTTEAVESRPIGTGYGLKPAPGPPRAADPDSDPEPSRPRKARRQKRKRETNVEGSRRIEPWWRLDLFFPLRGAEGLGMVASLGVGFWVLTILVPEFCLALLADADKLGASLMGKLIALIASLPALMLILPAILYALQYLGRVLISGAMGDTIPPRSPDRNFEGLFGGIGPWLVWLASGASVGFMPLAWYAFSRSWDEPLNPAFALGLLSVGLPYALMSLMMTLLLEGGMPKPLGVVWALARLNVGFLGVCALITLLVAVVGGAFAAVHSLRTAHFAIYILAGLGWWFLAIWLAIVVMRSLGVFYFHHRTILRWHRDRPWWSVTGET